ncbi:glycoside hydrolase/phage tail family protein [Stappia taiwanensis]|uniref:Glycoside hydrolase/phage tail family protein n=1 Tax=Stappia taiwanensis TaxID=992267 RepID=A0A838XPE6_9HYPH|nr:glycoside hydrolase/phage tail family protein [Stappia taiwanensis]MBA4610931.1 glycoside hydrolase/phage tail family protein [Stappia taiwanensis]GGE94735.1 hypothetical protein GCM10007285_22980 [Stappia taiwanensis]
MATLILAAAGKALGGALLGGFGALLGQAAGAVAGYAFDQALFGGSRTIEGRRLDDLSVQSSTEGAPLPMVYGRARLAGQIIWATRFEEVVQEESSGGKGGGPSATVRSYRYFANFAVALCAGPVARIGAVWADGKPLDLTGITCRFYHGDADQLPDPLIAARQGDTPAYRNTAYVVFERLPLEPFGDRLPQLTFEVIRTVEPLEQMVRAVTLIPGAGEFVYDPAVVTHSPRPGVSEEVNRVVLHAASNWTASLDELQALCPNLERVALVVAWFGDDLRCGSCTVTPRVEAKGGTTTGATWGVGGLSRYQAREVSQTGGRPAYGGTPSDASVIAAIRDLKARGLKVSLYPFLMMDVPAGNGLPDPYGGAEQAPHPWRGRMTASLAPGEPGSPDGSAVAAAEVAAFAGSAAPGQFSNWPAGTIRYVGPAEWSYRRFILHYAHLALAAGGVDAFLIGSEMRGLTRLRSGPGVYPFVTALKALAGDVKGLLGTAKVTYAADWTEYGGDVPEAGELRFPLDPLWADPAIDAVAIDAYFPLADQRHGGDPDGRTDPYDLDALRAHVAGGEDHDWYYASPEDRAAGLRTPITDGAHAKPWVFRAKDLKGWWSNPHVERVGGVELGAPTDWVPMSKPIWLSELGVPAVDAGANQPNVFHDAKSSESALPHFSNGGRDDLIQRRALEAVLSWWSGDHPRLGIGDNPLSPVYGGPMVDADRIYLWSWDARPYPAFPVKTDLWSDGDNWRTGHWLTGRLGGATLEGMIRLLAEDFGVPADVFRCAGLSGTLDGMTVAGPVALRSVLMPLLDALGAVAVDQGAVIAFRPAWSPPVATLSADGIAEPEAGAALVSIRRAQDADLPAEIRVAARDSGRDHRRFLVSSRRREGHSRRVEDLDLGGSVDPGRARALADRLLARRWSEREEVTLALPPGRLDIEPGDVVTLAADPVLGSTAPVDMRIEAVEEGLLRRLRARRVMPPPRADGKARGGEARPRAVRGAIGAAELLILDLPPLPDDPAPHAPRMAAFAVPWPGALDVYRAQAGAPPSLHARIDAPAILGTTKAALAPGPLGVWDRAARLEVELHGGTLSSRARLDVLGGVNSLAVHAPGGGIEIIQFQTAELIGPRRYLLKGLLRGLLGTDAGAAAGAPEGAGVLLLNEALVTLPLSRDELGLPFDYTAVPSGAPLDSPARADLSHTASGLGLMPFSPVHLKARRQADGAVSFSWIRRTRTAGDGWIGTDVPLGEEREAYRVELLGSGAVPLVSREVETTSLRLDPAEELALFGAVQSSFTLRLRQLSAVMGNGLPATATLQL